MFPKARVIKGVTLVIVGGRVEEGIGEGFALSANNSAICVQEILKVASESIAAFLLTLGSIKGSPLKS